MDSFANSVDLLHRALDVQSLRYQVTANNIANSETPGFKRQSVSFENELKHVLESRNAAHEQFKMAATDERHVHSDAPHSWRDVEPRRISDCISACKANGNNVDAEQEAMNIVQIQMQYNLLTRLMDFEFSQVDTAMN